MSLEDKIKEIIVDCLAIDEEIKMEDRLLDLGADSLDLLDLTHRLDKEFDTAISLTETITVQGVIEHVAASQFNS